MIVLMATWTFAAEPVDAPSFEASHPHDAEVAKVAWEAGVACAGRQGESHPTVVIQRRRIRGGYLGMAHTDEQGLYRIELDAASRNNEVLVHEIAHAWVHTGPSTLVEGAAELLADCMAQQHPDVLALPADDGRDLHAMPDLRTWNPEPQSGPAPLPFVRTDGYLGAARLYRLVSHHVSLSKLVAQSQTSWPGFRELVARSGGQKVLTMLDGGVQEQRLALSDEDKDGLTRAAERLKGTNELVFDSDQDGWWDGAQAPKGAWPMPLSGSLLCSGSHERPDVGGNLRGVGLGALRMTKLPHGQVLSLGDDDTGETSGGMWVQVQDEPGDACANDRDFSVFTVGQERHDVDDFLARLGRAKARAEKTLGQMPSRLAVGLGGSKTTIEGATVYFSERELAAAVTDEQKEHLANLAVALRHTWLNGVRNWSSAEGVARYIAGPTP